MRVHHYIFILETVIVQLRGNLKVEMFNIIKVWTKNEKKVIEKFPELYENAHSRVCWAYYSVLDLRIKSNVQKEYKKKSSR